jgi:hypothetical protein
MSYAVRRYVRQSNRWEDISYIGENGSFRGAANKFSTKNEAQQYLQEYRLRMRRRFSNERVEKLLLKVFDSADTSGNAINFKVPRVYR